ncbi:phosphoenolpyruvate synthase [Leifsonia sp. AG29]|uniref:phosphoenolpyruvate synthase n=1 Tax=Leifsonia sp. AG29 TaxID=2598860 RepID=UPI00131ABFFE|nr:phosphoenolpyruvate synthase [Leifsonia sp. AG29]
MDEYVVWFEEVGVGDVPRVGGKNASLGEMIRSLSTAGIRVPGGFATTASAYRAFVAANRIEPAIREHVAQYRAGTITLRQAGEALRRLFLAGEFPADIAEAIVATYRALGERAGSAAPAVAVRSSATAEDLPEASFAGAQETFLNVTGERDLMDACRRCYASLFTDRAISYREVRGFDHLQVALSIGVQTMVRSDLGGSGVMFSIDTETGFPEAVVISAAWGLGELVVQGSVDPDRYQVFKPLLDEPGARPIIEKSLGGKAHKMVYGGGGTARTRTIDTPVRERRAFVLSDDEILLLARWARSVEEHYGRPMDMEWARDGATGELFLVQARPETVQSAKSGSVFTQHHLTGTGPLLLSGAAIGDSIATGTACVIRDPSQIARFRDGAVLVAEMTDPDWVAIIARASGIITDHGGSTSHAAIVARELGIPAVVGTGTATETLEDGRTVTLSCAEGDIGHVYDGELAFETEEIDLARVPATRTRVCVNVASPDAAFRWWRLPTAGVGLARMEFIVNTLIGIHPMALVHPERVTDESDRARIAELTRAFDDPREFFVERLALGIAKLAAPYHPHDVVVRMSDFKANEYAHLLGGSSFETPEENPMLGFRGASRYYDPRYREGFALECAAVKRARERMGFANIIPMVPFCRTPGEADRVLDEMAANGLARGEAGLRVYMMCEIPSNVIRASEFARRFDGFSIGSNDLTQLVLGVDRDSEQLAALFDERDAAVEWMIAEAIRKAHEAGIPIGICGQAPSDHPDFAAFLVANGIDSISLNPDSFLRTVGPIAQAEALSAPAAEPVMPRG